MFVVLFPLLCDHTGTVIMKEVVHFCELMHFLFFLSTLTQRCSKLTQHIIYWAQFVLFFIFMDYLIFCWFIFLYLCTEYLPVFYHHWLSLSCLSFWGILAPPSDRNVLLQHLFLLLWTGGGEAFLKNCTAFHLKLISHVQDKQDDFR